MTDEQIEQFIERMRSRRLVIAVAYQQMSAIRSQIRTEAILKKIEIRCARLIKIGGKCDELVDKALNIQNEIRAFRIQAMDAGEDVDVENL